MNPASAPLAGRCVWVVEDVATLRLLVAMRLRNAGADVVEAADGAEVRALLPTARGADVVLLDLGLPDVDGLSLAAELGAERCLAFTASTDDATRERCLRAGLAGLVDKTASEELLPELVDFLRRRRDRSIAAVSVRRPLADEEALLRRRYIEFLREQRRALADFFRAAWPTDPARVRSIAHRLSGTAVHFGLPELGPLAKNLSAALRGEDPEAVRSAHEQLDAALARAVDGTEIIHARTGENAPCAS